MLGDLDLVRGIRRNTSTSHQIKMGKNCKNPHNMQVHSLTISIYGVTAITSNARKF